MTGSMGTLSAIIADAAIRATVLLTATALASVLLRRAAAATRHLVWALGLLGTMALPLLMQTLPPLHWTVPRVSHRHAPTPESPASNALDGRSTAQSTLAPAQVDAPTGRAASVLSSYPRHVWPILALLWLPGTLMALGRLLSGVMAVRCIVRASQSIGSGALMASAEDARRILGLGRQVAFRLASGPKGAWVPMSWGFIHPTVVLPAEAEYWPQERARAVLLHELAHIQRQDWVVLMLAQFACALYWFHPLAWLATRQVRQESEHACDNLVLGAGVGPAHYADHILAVARYARARRGTPVAAMAMVHPSALGRRVEAVLDPRAYRGGRTPQAVAAALALTGAFVCALAALGPIGAAAMSGTPTTELHGVVVAVDAGHGGTDTGYLGPNGVREKSLNLALAQQLRSDLQQHGATVYMIRDDDTYVDVSKRAGLAAAHHADYLISLHCVINRHQGDRPLEAQVFFHADLKHRLAVTISQGVSEATGISSHVISDRTVFPGGNGFSILRGARMPAVLIEFGNILSPQDLARLRDPQEQQKIADGIKAGLIAFQRQSHRAAGGLAQRRQG